MSEWTSLVKQALGISLLLVFIGAVSIVVFISSNEANKRIESFAAKANFEDYSDYDGLVMDKPGARNILRANKNRLTMFVGSDSEPISDDPSLAHAQINNFLNKSSVKKYKIYIERDVNDGIVNAMRIKEL